MIEWGITSVSVNPDITERTRAIVAIAEEVLTSRPSRLRRLARAT